MFTLPLYIGNKNRKAIYEYLYIYLSIYGSTVLLLGLVRFFSFLILQTAGRTLRTGDQPMSLPTQRTAQTQNKRTQTSISWVGFETTVSAFERQKRVHSLYRAATLIGDRKAVQSLKCESREHWWEEEMNFVMYLCLRVKSSHLFRTLSVTGIR
jgi:hypothetical protein